MTLFAMKMLLVAAGVAPMVLASRPVNITATRVSALSSRHCSRSPGWP